MFESFRRATQMVQRAFMALDNAGFEQQRSFQTIGSQQGCFGGFGVAVAGIQDASDLREIGAELVDLPDFKLFYVHPRYPGAIFAGEIARDERELINKVSQRTFSDQQDLEFDEFDFTPESEEYSTELVSIEVRANSILHQICEYDVVSASVEHDETGFFLVSRGLPDVEAAIAVQKRFITELTEFDFSVRLEDPTNGWLVFMMEKAP